MCFELRMKDEIIVCSVCCESGKSSRMIPRVLYPLDDTVRFQDIDPRSGFVGWTWTLDLYTTEYEKQPLLYSVASCEGSKFCFCDKYLL